ncbi:hypothetical protein AX16_003067 [Volvariella volvacea WC 439]|nr:hypothetical protein AX16_003067 [Volvariella volvacea WC 439]
MADEIGNQIWCFNAKKISQMLSPKKPKDGLTDGQHYFLNNYNCDVDLPSIKNAFSAAEQALTTSYPSLHAGPTAATNTPPPWLTDQSKTSYYQPLANFLNECASAGASVLISYPPKRWYNKLKFVVYNRTLVDGVGDASPPKPGLAGGNALETSERLYWSPPLNKESLRMQLPVEVKG